MIIIFKDYKRLPVEIDAIRVADMDKIKEWLDSINIVCSLEAPNVDLHRVRRLLQLEGVHGAGARGPALLVKQR